MMSIYEQLQTYRKEVRTDSYPMSIGEIINLYRDEELILRPEYQRLFRWSDEEKSALIESILLGLPIPTIFVEEDKETNKWAVVDGLQRLSTILQFVGVLKKADGELEKKLRLVGLEKMSFLSGKTIDDIDLPTIRLFKKEKFYLSSIKAESSPDAKYELFIRLNRSGQRLTNQEIRNALLDKENPTLLKFFQELKRNEHFTELVNISEGQTQDETDTEFVVRFFALKNMTEETVKKYGSLNSLFDDFVLGKCTSGNSLLILDYEKEREIFERTFSLLMAVDGTSGKCLRKYDPSTKRFKGKVTIANYSVLAIGLGRYLSEHHEPLTVEQIENCIKGYWNEPLEASTLSSYDLAFRSIQRGKQVYAAKY
jgi:hypothetical protein